MIGEFKKATWCVGWLEMKTMSTDNWHHLFNWTLNDKKGEMIIQAMALLFQPHCLSHFKWTGNYFNFSGTSTWRGFSVLIQVIRIKNAICLTNRKKSLWATDMEVQGLQKGWTAQHVNEVQCERSSALLGPSISTDEVTVQLRSSQVLPFSCRTYVIN